MPIRGLTDRGHAAFPRIGKLRKGGEAKRDQNGKVTRPGADLEYFRFTSERPEVLAAFRQAYGDAPALINCFVPYATADEAFECWKEKWVAGGLVHRCDGETQLLWLDKDGTYNTTTKKCDGGCDEVGRLSLWIPELIQAGFVGVVTLELHGINDLLSVQSSLLAGLEVRGHSEAGLKGIKWTLRRVKEKISTPGTNGQRVRREKWLVKLEPSPDWVQSRLQAAHNATMMLPAPREVEPEQVDEETGEIARAARGPVIDAEYEPFEMPEEPPEEEEDEPISTDLAATPTPEPQDEERSKADLREKIGKLADARKISAVQLDTYCQKHYQVAYADASLDTLIALQQVLAEQGKARA